MKNAGPSARLKLFRRCPVNQLTHALHTLFSWEDEKSSPCEFRDISLFQEDRIHEKMQELLSLGSKIDEKF